jgi:UDP-N-acetylglucosamine 2-epimerase
VADTAARRRIVSVVGTRPEAIKMVPVVRALAARGEAAQTVLLTGQHSGLAAHFAALDCDLRELGVDPGGLSHEALTWGLTQQLEEALPAQPCDLVLVQGDTASALAGALAARACGIPVGHVEAGLRSFDPAQPWPEEGIRIAVDILSDLLFAPTAGAAANLAAEPLVTGTVHVTGNSGIDALMEARAALGPVPAARPGKRRTILVTCHRKENQGVGIVAIAAAIRRLVAELPVEIVLPLHPNRHVRAAVAAALEGAPHVRLIEPVCHAGMVRLILESWLVLTDSGGLQEEAPTLGRPVLALREVTERQEAVASGNVALVGTDPNRIVAAVATLLGDLSSYRLMARPTLLFGDGRASARIADAVGAWLLSRPPASAARPAALVPQAAPLAVR